MRFFVRGSVCCIMCQALDRLTSFKSRLKKRIWQDHRKIDWQEEDAHLRRASKGLTKAIHVITILDQNLTKKTLIGVGSVALHMAITPYVPENEKFSRYAYTMYLVTCKTLTLLPYIQHGAGHAAGARGKTTYYRVLAR